MQIKKALNEGALQLLEVSDIPKKEAMIFLSEVLQKETVWLIANNDAIVDIPQKYFDFIERRATCEPLEYILNKAGFYKEEFYVDKRVLIPRPETEILVDKVVELASFVENPRIVEIGTGSGIISIMLSRLLSDLHVRATDISSDALEVAKLNAEKFKVSNKIDFVHGSYLDGIDTQIDILVSNPPYIAKDARLEKNLSYEPSLALFGGEKGDEMLFEIIDLAFERDVRFLVCEMGYDQKKPISDHVAKKGATTYFYEDFQGFDRGFWVDLGKRR
ncbi:MAG: peptide chain release factor N(5)-glutamine methyltransferase [Sulfurospirillaceae bacterium]|nr:peptide chain release factor N(5)-glutamine methyltransferase [Sulfurospirillaceae bacterium]MDD3462963.1 peptide chain release factor N(5)-glutamine methyltransferase [Sulfurospirillaceae bacterium]